MKKVDREKTRRPAGISEFHQRQSGPPFGPRAICMATTQYYNNGAALACEILAPLAPLPLTRRRTKEHISTIDENKAYVLIEQEFAKCVCVCVSHRDRGDRSLNRGASCDERLCLLTRRTHTHTSPIQIKLTSADVSKLHGRRLRPSTRLSECLPISPELFFYTLKILSLCIWNLFLVAQSGPALFI